MARQFEEQYFWLNLLHFFDWFNTWKGSWWLAYEPSTSSKWGETLKTKLWTKQKKQMECTWLNHADYLEDEFESVAGALVLEDGDNYNNSCRNSKCVTK